MHKRMIELESERLLLRQWQKTDIEPYARFYADEEMARFVGGKKTREEAWLILASVIGHWHLRGFGFFAAEEKDTGDFVGCVGLLEPEGWPEMELGYWVMRDMQGKGYATEAAMRVREYAYKEMGSTTLVSYIHPDNEPSKKVALRLGAILEDTIELGTFGPHCAYRHPGP
jgi:RimJ/RimL family protein N-acetyltransferase